MSSKTYYDTLGVNNDATPAQLRDAYLVRCKMFHPDRFDPTQQANEWRLANEMIQELNRAYHVLRDLRSRSAYDSYIQGGPQPQPPQACRPTPARQEQRRQTPPDLGVLKSGYSRYADLPLTSRDRLSQRTSQKNMQQYITSLHGVGWNYFVLFLCLSWFVYMFFLAQDADIFYLARSEGQELTNWIWGISAVAAFFTGTNMSWITRWHKSPLRCNFLVTPLYFIKTHLDEVWFWPLWHLKDLSVTHDYRKGPFTQTDARFVFDTGAENLSFSNRTVYEQVVETARAFDTKLRGAKQRGECQYLLSEDDFSGWVPDNRSKPKRGPDLITVLSVASSLGLAALLTLAAVEINSLKFPASKPTQLRTKYPSRSVDERTCAPISVDTDSTGTSVRFAAIQPVTPRRPTYTYTTKKTASFEDLPDKGIPASSGDSTDPFAGRPDYIEGVTELTPPPSGEVQRYTTQGGRAPLQICSSPGANYLLKIDDETTGRPIISVFVRGGQTETIYVPLGTFVVKYASGTRWYGYAHRFGPDTQYSKADQTFSFTFDGHQYSGYSITLFKVRDGNLRTSKILPEDF